MWFRVESTETSALFGFTFQFNVNFDPVSLIIYQHNELPLNSSIISAAERIDTEDS